MDPQELSPQELVKTCLDSQDEAMWVEFVRRFQPLIAGVIARRIYRHTGHHSNRTVVDDLVQDTYLKLCSNNFKALREFNFQHENALCGFLKVVATHVAEDQFRSDRAGKRGSGREEEDLDRVKASASSASETSDSLERELLIGRINQCLQEHAGEPNFVRDYAIFWLYYRQGLTAKAIAELPGIGLSVKGVESTLLRLTRLVRAKLVISRARKMASG
jgi:RNA polymerase sigma-70 factor (ECF subfamily)